MTPSEAPSKERIEQAVAQHRQGPLMIQTEPNSRVTVRQLRHEFWFGATLNRAVFAGMVPGAPDEPEYSQVSDEDRERYLETFLTHFNAGVTDNQLKWHQMEPKRGHVNYALVDATLAWAVQHDIPVRGHCLFWGIPQFIQDWVKGLNDHDLRRALEARARGVAARYRGHFVEYDLNNEMIHGNFYADRLGLPITVEMARWVKEGDPDAVIFVNDYDVLTGNRLSDYCAHIGDLLHYEVPLGGIGVQGHLHGDTFDEDALQSALDRLSEFGLPIRITEFNMPGQRSRYAQEHSQAELSPEEEEAKAEALTRYFEICFAHASVTGILLWGFWEGANWIPQSSLWKRDWTPTPAASAYRKLVRERWWTDWSGTANDRGVCEVPVFFGKHEVSANGRSTTVTVSKAEGRATIEL